MSPIRVSRRRSKAAPVRTTYGVKPVTLPSFSFYGHLPVTYHEGELVIGGRGVALEGRS
jgi:hypothetical protein